MLFGVFRDTGRMADSLWICGAVLCIITVLHDFDGDGRKHSPMGIKPTAFRPRETDPELKNLVGMGWKLLVLLLLVWLHRVVMAKYASLPTDGVFFQMRSHPRRLILPERIVVEFLLLSYALFPDPLHLLMLFMWCLAMGVLRSRIHECVKLAEEPKQFLVWFLALDFLLMADLGVYLYYCSTTTTTRENDCGRTFLLLACHCILLAVEALTLVLQVSEHQERNALDRMRTTRAEMHQVQTWLQQQQQQQGSSKRSQAENVPEDVLRKWDFQLGQSERYHVTNAVMLNMAGLCLWLLCHALRTFHIFHAWSFHGWQSPTADGAFACLFLLELVEVYDLWTLWVPFAVAPDGTKSFDEDEEEEQRPVTPGANASFLTSPPYHDKRAMKEVLDDTTDPRSSPPLGVPVALGEHGLVKRDAELELVGDTWKESKDEVGGCPTDDAIDTTSLVQPATSNIDCMEASTTPDALVEDHIQGHTDSDIVKRATVLPSLEECTGDADPVVAASVERPLESTHFQEPVHGNVDPAADTWIVQSTRNPSVSEDGMRGDQDANSASIDDTSNLTLTVECAPGNADLLVAGWDLVDKTSVEMQPTSP